MLDIVLMDYIIFTGKDIVKNNYEYESEDVEKKQSDKKPDKKATWNTEKKNWKNFLKKSKEFNELINKEETDRNIELFRKHFSFQRHSEMLKAVYATNNKRKNEKLVTMIESGASDIKNEIKEMSDDEIEIEKPDKIVNIVEKILEFNRQNQEGQGLKILTADQMISRSPISVAQLIVGNNSEKLKNEIRQLLYCLYRWKKLTKAIFNNLINTI